LDVARDMMTGEANRRNEKEILERGRETNTQKGLNASIQTTYNDLLKRLI
jgi:hypothetical protein